MTAFVLGEKVFRQCSKSGFSFQITLTNPTATRLQNKLAKVTNYDKKNTHTTAEC
jgi:hypothetical protein